MKYLKIIFFLLTIFITCTAFSQSNVGISMVNTTEVLQQQLNTCDSVKNNQTLQILNFRKVVSKDKTLINEIQLDNQALEKNLELVTLHLQKTKKTTKILIATTLFVGIFSGYLVGYFTTKE